MIRSRSLGALRCSVVPEIATIHGFWASKLREGLRGALCGTAPMRGCCPAVPFSWHCDRIVEDHRQAQSKAIAPNSGCETAAKTPAASRG